MKCPFCSGVVKKGRTTFTYEAKDKYIFIENVPAEICATCWEKMYSTELTDKILKFSQNTFEPVKIVKVPVYDFMEIF